MGKAQSFGQRRAAAYASAPLCTPVQTACAPRQAAAATPVGAQWPFFTLTLVIALTAIFFEQVRAAQGQFTLATLIAEGAQSRDLVAGQGAWWRMLTAPLLHGSAAHLGGNMTALLVAGFYLERTIGRGWMAAIYFVSAIGGAMGSLIYSDLVSVGASGAIMGLVAAMLAISFHDGVSTRWTWRMRRYSLFTMIPALLPSAAHGGAMIDIGAHAGGVAAGTVMGFALLMYWPEETEHPPCPLAVVAFGLFGMVFSACALSLTTLPDARALAPLPARPSEATIELSPQVPDDLESGVANSDELAERFPHDPRAQLYRAVYFLRRSDAVDAVPHLETALKLIDSKPEIFAAHLRDEVQATLAVTLLLQGRRDAAAREGAATCASGSRDHVVTAMRAMLRKHGMCG